MIGIILALINPILTTTQSVLAKVSLKETENDWAVVFARLFYTLPILIPYYFISSHHSYTLTPLFWFCMGIMIICEIPGQWFFHQAIKLKEISIVTPLLALLNIPLLISFVWSGMWSWVAFIGIVITTISIYTIYSKKNLSCLEPIKMIYYSKESRYMLIAILCWTITTILQGITISMVGVESMALIYLSGSSSIALAWCVYKKYPLRKVLWPQRPFITIGIGLIAGCAALAQYSAIALIGPSYTIALKETSLLWNIGFERVIFNYHPTKREILGIVGTVIGAALVGMGLITQ